MIIWNLILILVLVALNGFFVAIEFSAVASRKSRIELLAKENNKSAKIVESWLESTATRDRLIAGSQLGITIVSLALGAVGENTFEAILEPFFHNVTLPQGLQSLKSIFAALPLVVSLIIITSVHVIFGEQVPKVATLHAPEKFALLGAHPMKWFETIFKWFVDILDWSTRQVLKLMGLKHGGGHSLVYTVEEIKHIVDESEEVGVLEEPDKEMLHAIFDIGDMLARQVMIPRTEVLAFRADTSIEESIHLATESPFTKFPVYEKDLDHIVGIVYIKDILRVLQDPEKHNYTVKNLMHEGLFVPETLSVKALLQQFRIRRQHIAIVLDEYGGTAGLVTLEDVMREIVGEVSDFFDISQPEIQSMPDGSVIIDGIALLDEVNEELGLNLVEPNYDTIAGYVLGRLDRLPKQGDVVEIDGIRIKVAEMDGMRISKLVLNHIPKDEVSPVTIED
ncbi:MAG: HlyC/CorC family transporter [Anaerolineales bacterium]|nr:HlyC/CorC family transporter [Anaerolineales bacterium]